MSETTYPREKKALNGSTYAHSIVNTQQLVEALPKA
jgi:hypothetical protein